MPKPFELPAGREWVQVRAGGAPTSRKTCGLRPLRCAPAIPRCCTTARFGCGLPIEVDGWTYRRSIRQGEPSRSDGSLSRLRKATTSSASSIQRLGAYFRYGGRREVHSQRLGCMWIAALPVSAAHSTSDVSKLGLVLASRPPAPRSCCSHAGPAAVDRGESAG